MPTLLLLPLDDRPATRGLLLQLARLTGFRLLAPPAGLLGHRRTAARVPEVWAWVESHAGEADAMIAAWEMLAYGGLVASRIGLDTLDATRGYADRLERLAAGHPGLRIYLAAVDTRIPVHGASAEEPGYWMRRAPEIAAYSEARDRADLGLDAGVAAAARALPPEVLDDLLWRRRRNLLAILDLCALAARGALTCLLVGQDDTPRYGLARSDLAAIRGHAARLRSGRIMVTHGADELLVRLLARAAGDVLGARPSVEVAYTWPDAASRVPKYESAPLDVTVAEHVAGAGAALADSGDLFLLVHNFPEESQAEADDPRAPDVEAFARARALLRSHHAVRGVADLHYANGADDLFARLLLSHPNALGIGAYAGWNTASNSLGTALAHLILAWHAREGRLPADEAGHRRALLDRFLDDWGYQAVVRPALARDVLPRLGADPAGLGAHAAAVRRAALDLFRRDVLPLLPTAFGAPVEIDDLAFPWDRLFEAEITAHVVTPTEIRRG